MVDKIPVLDSSKSEDPLMQPTEFYTKIVIP